MFKWKPSVQERQSFVFVMVIGLGLLGGWATWRGHSESSFWIWGLACVLGILAWVMPRAVLPFYWAWMGFGEVMGAISSRVILFLVFYVGITPVAIFFRLRGRDELRIKPGKGSYWIDHPPINVEIDSKHIF